MKTIVVKVTTVLAAVALALGLAVTVTSPANAAGVCVSQSINSLTMNLMYFNDSTDYWHTVLRRTTAPCDQLKVYGGWLTRSSSSDAIESECVQHRSRTFYENGQTRVLTDWTEVWRGELAYLRRSAVQAGVRFRIESRACTSYLRVFEKQPRFTYYY